jgi:formyl-CoA transferase
MTSTPPLQGTTVVSLEQAVAAPFATRQLADLGARVIKIERPGGGDFARGYDEAVHGNSSYFVWLNRSKESLTLDVKSAEGRTILGELLDRADVLVQNLGPGAAGRLGIDPPTLAKTYPRLVPCTVSGWGTDGPWADRKAYDLLVQCETGLLSLTGTPGQVAKVGISVADIAAGTVLLAVQNDREWRSLCAVVLGDPAAADDPRFVTNSARVAHRADLNELVGAVLSRLETAAATALLDRAGIASARINQVQDFLDHPVLAARHRWRSLAVPGGTMTALRPPVDLAGIEPVMGPVPAVGEHTDAILHELGRTDAAIAALRSRALV